MSWAKTINPNTADSHSKDIIFLHSERPILHRFLLSFRFTLMMKGADSDHWLHVYGVRFLRSKLFISKGQNFRVVSKARRLNQRRCLVIIYSLAAYAVHICVFVLPFQDNLLRVWTLGYWSVRVCVWECVSIMVMSRCVDFHVRQQRPLLTSLLLILSCVCVCLAGCDISPKTVFPSSFSGLELFNCSVTHSQKLTP